MTDAPWVITEDFINKHKIDYVTHDALPYTDTSGLAGGADVYDFVRSCSARLHAALISALQVSEPAPQQHARPGLSGLV